MNEATCGKRLSNPKDWDWYEPCDREPDHDGPCTHPLVRTRDA